MNSETVASNCEIKKTKEPTAHLSPAAERALAEADARRAEEKTAFAMREIGGRGGRDPARYGDWEVKGRAIDF